jgi:hypothetical protein
MDADADNPQFVWQPLTPRGIAAFAHASLGRLLLVQLVVALVAGSAVAWFLQRDWFPEITEAVGRLPAKGQIFAGRLDWDGESPQTLAEGRFLALTVDLDHTGGARSPAHVQIEFGRTDFRVLSLFGYARGKYPRGWTLAFNRPELAPRWGAWAPAVLAMGVGAVALALLLVWGLLATVYCGPAWLGGFFANRDLSLWQSWHLAGAALMPGALFMTGAILLYGLGALDLVRLTAAAVLHLAIGWLCLAFSLPCLPRHPEAASGKTNPFESKRRK